METLTSLHNPKIKNAAKLWKRREREETDCFLIEGYRELDRALRHEISIDTLFVCRELFLGTNEEKLITQVEWQGGEVYACTESVFRKVSYRDRPDGLIARARQRHLEISRLPHSSTPPLYIVAEAIEKPGNLGTILRSADAAQVQGVFVCDRCTDIYNPNVVRASVGTLFTLPVIEAKGEETRAWLRKEGVAIVSAMPAASLSYTEVDYTQPIAIVVGAEQYGLSTQWQEEADYQVRIPMLGVADSLNVAMATTILLYEAVRQRALSSTPCR